MRTGQSTARHAGERLAEARRYLRERWQIALVALAAGLVVFLVGEQVFPYHTLNHDEGVYLQQAELLLKGRLFLEPPVAESFRPWFFVADDGGLYPKYTPVTATFFALGGLVGSYRLAVAAIAAVAVVLTAAIVTELFDRRIGLLAAAILAVSPLFIVQAAVFLPYVPAFTLNLLFAWAYLRADRTDSVRFAALAGGAIGLSFWARPYTAVLFATPFVCHALWRLRSAERAVLLRQGITAALGLVGVAVALTYNAIVTGDPLLFPYEAFAPLDGLGFGHREIVGYEREYTPSLALEANARNLWQFATAWGPAGWLGTLVAVVGLATVARRSEWRDSRVLAVLALLVTIAVGNLYFWGTLNVLGDLSDPNDGLIATLGPYYHVGLLLPTVTLAAVGLRRIVDGVRAARARVDDRRVAHSLVAVALVLAVVASGVAAVALAQPLSDNYETTRQYERAYEPFDDREFENGLVFLPTPYGDWLNHPFQVLRNDPSFDGAAVYALQHREFAVVDAFADRQLYRYSYRGPWLPFAGQSVTPRLREIEHVAGERVRLDLSLGLPDAVETVDVSTSAGTGANGTSAALGSELNVTVVAENGTVTARSEAFAEPITVAHDGESPVELVTFVDYGALGGFDYVVRLPLVSEEGGYRAMTPYLEVCDSPGLCGGEATYVPGEHRSGVAMNATLSATD